MQHHFITPAAEAVPAAKRHIISYMHQNGASPSTTLSTDRMTDAYSRFFSPPA